MRTSLLLTKYYLGDDPVKENKVGSACGTYGREERCIEGFVGTPVRKRPPERPSGGWRDFKMDCGG